MSKYNIVVCVCVKRHEVQWSIVMCVERGGGGGVGRW